MPKILGLDLGTNSIGWAVVDDESKQIIKAGVRIFPAGVDGIGKGDKEISRNAERRDKRQQRRGVYRDKLRRIHLLKTLIELKMCPLESENLNQWKNYNKRFGSPGKTFPQTPEFNLWLKMNPYQLRSKALSEVLTLLELGRVFYHFIQRRGSLSNRKGKEDGAYKGKDNMTDIEQTDANTKNTTLGNYLLSILPEENKTYQKITDESGKELRVRARYTLRDMYIHEFNEIWKQQTENLNLNSITLPKIKTRFITGSGESSRNKKKIKSLYDKYGKENVSIDDKKITTKEQVPLKEYLAGYITEQVDGSLIHKSKESIIFYQRELRSQKGLLSKCSFEGRKFFDKKNNSFRIVGPTPAPISHPEYEEFKALQFINNIKYQNDTKSLDEHQREIVLNLFNSKTAAFKFSDIPKALKMTYERFNYDNDLSIPPNYTIANLKPLFTEKIWNEKREEIWHCFYDFEDDENLIAKLAKDYDLKETNFEKVKKINLKEDYASLSLKAIRNINPFLKKGYKYNQAVILGGVRNAFRKTDLNGTCLDRWDYFKDEHDTIEKAILAIIKTHNKKGETIEKIKQYLTENNYGFGKDDASFKRLYHHSQEVEDVKLKDKLDAIENLRNPIVQQSVNEVKRLVNELIDVYGKFDRINVELGREVKAGKDKRQEMTYKIRDNEKENDDARNRLTEMGLRHSRENIHKYLLFKEIETKHGIVTCPYTGKTISFTDAMGGNNKFQIEHIFPRSTSFDDSFANKTLCDAKFNGEKGNLTPYEFYLKNPDPKLWNARDWKAIKERAFDLLPYKKANKFCTEKSATDKPDSKEFIERQLNDTRYIGVKTKEILSEICPDVRVLTGKLTSELRRLWGLNNILQPVQTVNFSGLDIDGDKVVPHCLITDKDDNIITLKPIYNRKPEIGEHEITIPGYIKAYQFNSDFLKSKKYPADEYKDGKYWAKIKLSAKPAGIFSVFADKPEKGEGEIIIKGDVKGGTYSNENLGNLPAKLDEGKYWYKAKIKNINYIKPEKKQPSKTKNQLLVYGESIAALFHCYLFDSVCDKGDGEYWALVDLDIETGEFFKIRNQTPTITEKQIIVEGNIDNAGTFSTDMDRNFTFQSAEKHGKYWAVFDNETENPEYYPVENKITAEKDQKTVEGSVWVDKYTAEIKFDPKKNRDDHRHHAIDAMAIALSKQSHVQHLSNYYENEDEKERNNLHDKIQFPEPWENFRHDAEKMASQILISYKINKNKRKALVKISKTIVKNGKKYISKGNAVRSFLHKDNVYGQRQAPNAEKAFHIRKDVKSLKDATQYEKIVDKTIKEIVIRSKAEEERINKELDKLKKQLLKAKDTEEQSILEKINELTKERSLLYTLPNKNGGDPVPIKKVRIKENFGNAQVLKQKEIVKEKTGEIVGLNQHVNPRNNHHVAIYKREDGALFEKIVTFWEAAERKKQGLPVVDNSPTDGSVFVTSLIENDMFILGLTPEQINWTEPNYHLLNTHLYRVQKISFGDYSFRHHLASTLDNPKEEIRIASYSAWKKINPIKVKIDILGNISKAE